MSDLIFRCSSLHRLMGSAKSIDESLMNEYIIAMKKHCDIVKKRKKQEDYEIEFIKLFEIEMKKLIDMALSSGAKTLVKEMVRKLKHNPPNKFGGSKETQKGHLVENDAIEFLCEQKDMFAQKNEKFFINDFVCGTPDIIDKDIHDTKCPWTYWTMEYFAEDIESKSTDAGYDWQQLGYMWLLRDNKEFEPRIIDTAWLDYILMPTPQECLTRYDDEYLHIDFVNEMNPKDRISSYKVEYDQSKIDLIKIKIESARKYAETLEF